MNGWLTSLCSRRRQVRFRAARLKRHVRSLKERHNHQDNDSMSTAPSLCRTAARLERAGRLRLLSGIMTSILLTSPSYGYSHQAPRADSHPASSDVRAAIVALEGYSQALVDRDYAKLRDRFLHVPFVVVDGAPRVVTSVEAVVAGLRIVRESLDAADYTTTRVESLRVSVLAKDRLLLNCRLHHLRKDGSLLSERANFYVMVRVAGAWKVGGIIPQDPALVD